MRIIDKFLVSLAFFLSQMNIKKYSKRILGIKERAHSSRKCWHSCGYSKKKLFRAANVQEISKLDFSTSDAKLFKNNYLKPLIPAIITNAMSDWRANKEWTLERLLFKYSSEKFKVGEDDSGKSVFISFKDFYYYCNDDPNGACIDDSPLYIFDSTVWKRTDFNTSKKVVSTIHRRLSQATVHLSADYSPISYFDDDLFRLTGHRRPPYRWIVIGPARSGTNIHMDPLGTSAWNAVISGHKRWCMFPPETPKSVYKAVGRGIEAVDWFQTCYSLLVKDDGYGGSLAQKWGMIETIQGPGEVIFIPGGWAHIVINIDFCIAVTHNFCASETVDQVYLKTRNSRPKLAKKLRRNLVNSESLRNATFEQKKKYRKLGKRLDRVDSVPAFQESSESSSSSSSEDDQVGDEVIQLLCKCHGDPF